MQFSLVARYSRSSQHSIHSSNSHPCSATIIAATRATTVLLPTVLLRLPLAVTDQHLLAPTPPGSGGSGSGCSARLLLTAVSQPWVIAAALTTTTAAAAVI
jgi:hypothetical protein